MHPQSQHSHMPPKTYTGGSRTNHCCHPLRKFVKQVKFAQDKAIIDYKIPLPDDSRNDRKPSRELDLSDPARPAIHLARTLAQTAYQSGIGRRSPNREPKE